MATRDSNRCPEGAWLNVTPAPLWSLKNTRSTLRCVARRLARIGQSSSRSMSVEAVRQAGVARASTCNGRIAVPLTFCVHVLCDLSAQGWTLRVTRDRIMALAPANGVDPLSEKARVRAAHMLERDAQLRQPAVRNFIRELERRRLFKGAWHSIFSLMRDGSLGIDCQDGHEVPSAAQEPARSDARASPAIVGGHLHTFSSEASIR